MEIKKAREIVIEIERIRTTRKRCRTTIIFCPSCSAEADFISLDEAAALFEVEKGLLRSFIDHHLCCGEQSEGEIMICLASFLVRMRAKTGSIESVKVESSERRMLN